MQTEGLQFVSEIRKRWDKDKFVCIGLDSDFSKLPSPFRSYKGTGNIHPVFSFNRKIIQNTYDLVAAYKINTAFYERNSWDNRALENTIETVREFDPTIPIIGDIKRADIEESSKYIAAAAFERYGFDGVTTSPLLGRDSIMPFLSYPSKGVFILCQTSNPRSLEYQDIPVNLVTYQHIQEYNGYPLSKNEYESAKKAARLYRDHVLAQKGIDISTGYISFSQLVAIKTLSLSADHPNIGLVVGATFPLSVKLIRETVPDLPFLLPGVGAQDGKIEKILPDAFDSTHKGVVISASRSILYASSGDDFAKAARQKTLELSSQIKLLHKKFSDP